MEYLIPGMIFAGSALMVYNVIRYAMFIKRNANLEKGTAAKGTTYIPLLLLIFFLVGYIGVGFSGIADILIASILLGGSVFVFLLLWVMFSIINNIRDTDKMLAARYEESKNRMDVLTKDSMSVLHVNLTKDEIEDLKGQFLYDSDFKAGSYTELIEARRANIVDRRRESQILSSLSRDGLLRFFDEGRTVVDETVLVRRGDGVVTFVSIEATLTKMPVSGDVVAFIVERPHNEEIVRRILLEKVLMDEYDRIAYIIGGRYKDFITNTGKKKGLILNAEEDDTYESIYLNHFLPAMRFDPVANAQKPNPLRLSVIEKALEKEDSYEVDAPFMIDGEEHYKHFVFYKINDEAKFYLMLLSDSTKVREEQEARNRELSDALAEAVRANEARSRFFTGISHSIRTPMNGILGFTELASKEDDPDTVRSYISKIDVCGRKLLVAVNDLFAMSLIESGNLVLEKSPADLAKLAEGTVSQIKLIEPEKELEVVADCSGLENTRVLCDEARINQILYRLLRNGAAFAPEQSRVTLSVAEDGDGDYVFRVTNKCAKLPPEIVENLFDAATWDANEDMSVLPGVGIGMTVAKALIDLMNGTVDVRCTDETMEFTIRIPLEADPSAASGPDGGESGLGSLSLLVVDDNEINREIAKLMLEGEGHKVDLAENGAEAVDRVKESGGRYDVVFMDVQMPVMNGYEATAAIRALPDASLASIPIIAMTANAYQEDRDAALNAGMTGYVPKPIDPASIRAALEKVLSK